MADFSDFQLKEYENISQAHFKTNQMITAFFRYYLIVMAIPITSVGALVALLGGNEQLGALQFWEVGISVFLFMFGALGFFMMCYMTGLTVESKLYARQVNSVRNFFMVMAEGANPPLQFNEVLPRDIRVPSFAKLGDHHYIIFSFSLFNTSYFLTAFLILWVQISNVDTSIAVSFPDATMCVSIILGVLLFVAQVGIHQLICSHKEKKWTRVSDVSENAGRSD